MSDNRLGKGQSIDNPFDMIVIGGGINGAGIALDASGRGLSVGLYESHDFASATSSASTKLIHGGLRYLEHYKFRLVRESLIERDILRKKAPHIIKPIRLCMPCHTKSRPRWLIRMGLFIYDHLYLGNTLEKSRSIDLKSNPDLIDTVNSGFEFSDCWVDDRQLVLSNIFEAQSNGVDVNHHCHVIKARKNCSSGWTITIKDELRNASYDRFSRVLVNATGPWVNETYKNVLNIESPANIRLVKGSHIIIKNTHFEQKNYLLQNTDGRIVFVLQYQEKYIMIGTTDIEVKGDLDNVVISEHEKDYLVSAYNHYFKRKITHQDIQGHFSGVRPLFDDKKDHAKEVTRDYMILYSNDDCAPLISIYGGKITTYRKLSEKVVNTLRDYFPSMKPAWTESSSLSSHATKKTHND